MPLDVDLGDAVEEVADQAGDSESEISELDLGSPAQPVSPPNEPQVDGPPGGDNPQPADDSAAATDGSDSSSSSDSAENVGPFGETDEAWGDDQNSDSSGG